MSRITFVTGTDTGVGKTLLTALLLQHLRRSGVEALAMKPFCTGPREDVTLLRTLQEGELTEAEMNPFYFPQPLAPLAAAGPTRRGPRLSEVIERIRAVARKCAHLIVEGIGGVLVPLGKGYSVRDLIGCLSCEVLLVARNRLGTINHTLLSVAALHEAAPKSLKVVLMDAARPDISAQANEGVLRECLGGTPVVRVPFLGTKANAAAAVRRNEHKLKKVLAHL